MQAKSDKTHITGAQPKNNLDKCIIYIGNILSGLFVITAIIIVFEIVARYVFDSPTFWVHETTTLLCAVLFLYGGPYCIAKDSHIRIVLIYDAVSKKTKRILNIFISTITIIYLCALSWAALQVAERALFAPWGDFRPETSGSAWDPALPAVVKTVLFIILIAMVVQSILHLISHIKQEAK
ncbi:MAG: TRAP transporter small permease [Rhizobiales bacterium]|nr:TRAP transporter small permease [Hyphomicrobiales bacterium]